MHRHEPMLLGYLELASGKSDAHHHLIMETAQLLKLFWFPNPPPKTGRQWLFENGCSCESIQFLLLLLAILLFLCIGVNQCCWDILSLRVGKVIYIYIYISIYHIHNLLMYKFIMTYLVLFFACLFPCRLPCRVPLP